MDRRLLMQIVERIPEKYPKSSAQISKEDARKLIGEFADIATREEPTENAKVFLRDLSKLYEEASTRKRFSAGELYKELGSLVEKISSVSATPDSGRSIGRLEKQIREIRSLISTSGAVEERMEDLEEQIEAIRKESRTNEVTSAEKHEDMLQKFLQADKRAFIIMPFQKDFENVWHGAIKPACVDSHFAALRVDEVNLSSLITNDIEKYSSMAGVVIVDLTGNNPNVMFELGWALGKNKQPIVICQGDQANNVAFDVRGIRHISYENSWLGIETLKKKLKEFITATDKSSTKKSTSKKTKKVE